MNKLNYLTSTETHDKLKISGSIINNKAKIILLLLATNGVVESIEAQIADPNPCIYDQISNHVFNLNEPFAIPLSGDYGADLGVAQNGSVFMLQKMMNGEYEPTGGTTAISGDAGDTLIITRVENTGDNEISWFDTDCDYEGGPGFGGTLNLVLPVTWLDNGAEKNEDGTTEIRWTVAQEINNEKFVVERTTDQVTWKAIDEVQGRGNANDQMTYSVTDESPRYGVNHYRIKQVDFDGKVSYSPIKSVKINEVSSKISIFPNPTADFVEVEGDAIESIVVYNELGHQMNVKVDGNRVDLSQLPNGLFVIETIQEGNNVQMHRIVKSSK